MNGCIEHLDGERRPLGLEGCELALEGHRLTAGFRGLFLSRVVPAAGILALFTVVVGVPLGVRMIRVALADPSKELLTPLMVTCYMILLVVAWVFLVTRQPSALPFFAAVALSQRIMRKSSNDEYRLIYCVNTAGRAARLLFKALQGKRRSWATPPTVADRALLIAYPLIDLELSGLANPQSIKKALLAYVDFLYYAAGLVATGRSDLIPSLRAYYERVHLLVCRTPSGPDGKLTERDVLFIDPMRNNSRWIVLKDYFYPLASWLSLVVSVSALVVSIAK